MNYFMKAVGLESTKENERKNNDALVREYKGFIISVRCHQATETFNGGYKVWIWTEEKGVLKSEFTNRGYTNECYLMLKEAKNKIDSLKK